jgi:hypothetical protein
VIICKTTRRAFLAAPLALVAQSADAQDDWQGVARIVAVGDVHGDKDAFTAVLRMAGLIDAQEKWVGGQTHLVQIGDIPARGTQTRQAFDFLMRLVRDAEAEGGRIHPLIGNHDAGVIYGDLRSTLPDEYGGFRTPNSEAKLEKAWSEQVSSMRRERRLPADAVELGKLKASWLESHPPGFVEHRAAFSPAGPYGSWIRLHDSVIRINDTLFVHGGISPKYARHSRAAMNVAVRRELTDPSRLLPGTATDTQGPLWYRGLAEGEELPLEPHLTSVLKFHQVRRIVIGHTVTRTAIVPRFGSRVVNIDLGLSRFYGRPPACLVLDAGSEYVIHRNSKIPLPGNGSGELVEYLRAIEAADVKPSPVSKLLETLLK